jgi:hypothetical protein
LREIATKLKVLPNVQSVGLSRVRPADDAADLVNRVDQIDKSCYYASGCWRPFPVSWVHLLSCSLVFGFYGLIAYNVTCRTSEIGVRLVLGAPRQRVVWLVLRESLKLAVIGLRLAYCSLCGAQRTQKPLFLE